MKTRKGGQRPERILLIYIRFVHSISVSKQLVEVMNNRLHTNTHTDMFTHHLIFVPG